MAAAEYDFESVAALLKPFTDNPIEVTQLQVQIATDETLTDKAKWQDHTKVILAHLPEELKPKVKEQLQAVIDNNWMVNGNPIIAKYQNYLKLYDITLKTPQQDRNWDNVNKAWLDIGKSQCKLSRAILLDCYFNPHRSNDPTPTFCGLRLPREFKFWDGKKLFAGLFAKVGNVFGILRSRTAGASPAGRARRAPRRFDLDAVTRLFEVRQQQLNYIIDNLSPVPSPSLGNGS